MAGHASPCKPCPCKPLLAITNIKVKRMQNASSKIKKIRRYGKTFSTPVTSISCHPTKFDVIALGYMDGLVRCCVFDVTKKKLQSVWSSRFKRSIRALEFSEDVISFIANRAACVYDVETGKRLRCIRKAHDDKPTKICVLPNADVVTGAENGEIRMWDFRKDEPIVATLKDQDDIVNAFGIYKNSVLAASGDCTVATYDYRQRRLRLRSEKMHSELLSIAVGDKFTYVGAADGHIEIFNSGEYGNILERLETPFPMGIDSMIMLRPQLLLTGSSMGDEMRFFHLSPNKQRRMTLSSLASVATHRLSGSDHFRTDRKDTHAEGTRCPRIKEKKQSNSNNESTIHDFYKDLLQDDKTKSDESEEIDEEEDDDEEVTGSEQGNTSEEDQEGEEESEGE
uniref:Uncharacterized protein n=1 Tax=Ditylenchus dipsaci TaxID=166011 RepID=A0A915CTM7_9BILA